MDFGTPTKPFKNTDIRGSVRKYPQAIVRTWYTDVLLHLLAETLRLLNRLARSCSISASACRRPRVFELLSTYPNSVTLVDPTTSMCVFRVCLGNGCTDGFHSIRLRALGATLPLLLGLVYNLRQVVGAPGAFQRAYQAPMRLHVLCHSCHF